MNLQEALERYRQLTEGKEPPVLSDAVIKKMIPMFVDSTKLDDHKCGTCSMRIVGPDGKGRCTVMDGPIDLKKGVCTFWAEGEASTEAKIHEARMSKELAGYVETKSPADKIQCGTCRFFDKGYCKLWMGSVKAEQCCIAYDSNTLK